MVATTHTVTLKIGADRVRVDASDEVQITHDLLAAGAVATVGLWRAPDAQGVPWPQTELYRLATVYAPVEIAVDGSVQVRGIVERVRLGADRTGAGLWISFRDTTCAAQVAEAPPSLSLRNVTLEVALRRLLDPLGINTTIGANADDARAALAGMRPGERAPSSRAARRRHHVDRFRVQPGSKVWGLVEELCRRHGYLAYTAPAGDGVGVIIDRPAYDSPVLYQLTRRRGYDGASEGTILAAWEDLDATSLPTEVTVYGHTSHTAHEDARHRATVLNETLTGSRVAEVFGSRPWHRRDQKARSPQIATQRARRLLADANASFRTIAATVQGFGQSGRLFAVNAMARIDDDETGIHGDFLITRVSMSRARGKGTLTELRLIPKGALVVEPDGDG